MLATKHPSNSESASAAQTRTTSPLTDATNLASQPPRKAKPKTKKDLERELKEIDDQEIWRAGKTVRSLRPDYKQS